MKKFTLLLFLAFILSAVFAGTIEQSYTFNNIQIKQSGNFDLISINGLFLTEKTGEPVLPYQAIKLLVPAGEVAVHIEVIGSEETLIPGFYTLYPQQSSRPLSQDDPIGFKQNMEVYSSDQAYPYQASGKLSMQYMNGYGIALSSFSPVLYHPATGQISYYKKVTIRLETKADNKASAHLSNLVASQNHQRSVEHFVQNPSMMATYSPPGKSVGDYQLLIITTQAYTDDFGAIVDLYKVRGLKTQVITTETINSSGTGQDLAEKIRNFIIQEYQAQSIEYVLLGGDVELVPYRGFYCYVQSGSGYEDSDIPADLYYAGLDGNWNTDGDNNWGEPGEDDLLPEIGIGRFSFSNTSELDHMIHKSVSYQNSPVLGEFTKALKAGEWLYNNPDTYGSDYLELLVGHHTDNGYETWGIPETYNFTDLYEVNAPWSAADLRAAINAGQQYVHHVGHANTTYVAYMSNSDISDANFYGANGIDHNYTFFQTHGCDCGGFDASDCILEKMVSINNFAAAVIGNSRYGWFNEGQTEGPSAHLHREMMDALYHEKINHIGAAFQECKIQTAPWVTAPGQWEEGALRWNFYDINILGDPALSVLTDEPISIDVNHSGVYLMGGGSYEVTVNSGSQPMENFRCTFIYNDEIYGVGITDASGFADISVDDIANPGDAQLIISGYNCLPTSYPVTVIPPGTTYVHYAGHTLHDALGNNNGLIDFNESLTMDLSLENIGTDQANTVSATLTTTDPYITITDNFADFGPIGANITSTQFDAFAFDVADNIPDQHAIAFDLEIDWDGDAVNTTINEVANAPVLSPGLYSINDVGGGNGNGMADPGESIEVLIDVSNTGHCACENTMADLQCNSSYGLVTSSNFSLGSLGVNESKTASFTMDIDAATPQGEILDLIYNVVSGNYTAQNIYNLPVGLVVEDFESGDFSMFGWEFTGNADWTITNQNPYEGTYSAKSGSINDNQNSGLQMDINVPVDDEISFYFKVSSESSYDFLRFFIDDNEIDSWSGEAAWQQATFDINAGEHTIKWLYEKDQSVSNGSDCAWLDYIVLPGTSGASPLSVNVTANPGTICQGESSQLNALDMGGSGLYSYLWTPALGLVNPNIADPIASLDSTTTFSVTILDANENVSADQTLNVNAVPEIPVISQNDQCLESSAASGNQWYNSNGPIAGANNPEYCPTATEHYYVIVSNAAGCSSEPSNIIYFVYTGMEETDLSTEISIYPNPSRGTFYLNTGIGINDLELRVSNMLNQCVWRKTIPHAGASQFILNLDQLKKGVYFMQMKSTGKYSVNGWYTKKIVIE